MKIVIIHDLNFIINHNFYSKYPQIEMRFLYQKKEDDEEAEEKKKKRRKWKDKDESQLNNQCFFFFSNIPKSKNPKKP